MHNSKNNEAENVVAVATVIQVQAPTSAKPGDKALIRANGFVDGWVGGGCVQPAITAMSREIMNSGQPCLLRVAPDGKWTPVEGLKDYASSCLGEGTVLLFMEPLIEQPSLCILGDSAVAQSLAEQAIHMNFNVSLHVSDASMVQASKRINVHTDFDCNKANFIVIATQGKGDKRAISAALQSTCLHIRMVVSGRKLEALKSQLRADGVSGDSLARINGPAGIDINARLPQEIALSVLAEIIQLRRTIQPQSVGASEVASESKGSSKLKANSKPVNAPPSNGGCCGE